MHTSLYVVRPTKTKLLLIQQGIGKGRNKGAAAGRPFPFPSYGKWRKMKITRGTPSNMHEG